ncbi:uncharacterized protein LOC143297507 [Babylonia areolata]|uniref:uncharacterized protein LOC143297507 n=1 Tax=Babylonia areolata TaxID=304850 RepID=UPI003FD594BB
MSMRISAFNLLSPKGSRAFDGDDKPPAPPTKAQTRKTLKLTTTARLQPHHLPRSQPTAPITFTFRSSASTSLDSIRLTELVPSSFPAKRTSQSDSVHLDVQIQIANSSIMRSAPFFVLCLLLASAGAVPTVRDPSEKLNQRPEGVLRRVRRTLRWSLQLGSSPRRRLETPKRRRSGDTSSPETSYKQPWEDERDIRQAFSPGL